MVQSLLKYCKNDPGSALNLRHIYEKHCMGMSSAKRVNLIDVDTVIMHGALTFK